MIPASTIFKELIIKAKTGDVDSFSEIYENFFTPLYKFVFYRTEDKELAEDITQVSFVKVFEKLSQIKTDEDASPMSYLYTTARNLIADHFRKVNSLPLDTKIDIKDEFNLQNEFENLERSKILSDVLSELSEEQRDILILRYINELSYEEIGKIINKTSETLRQIQHRSLKALKEKLDRINYK